MMKSTALKFLIILLVLQSCDDDNEPELEPVDFLSVSVGANHLLFEDMWVFASDETGKILDAQPVIPGSTVTLRTLSPPALVNLTIYYNGGSSPVNHLFYTYAGIARGEMITLDNIQNSNYLPPVGGKATISIQNCIPFAFFNLSDGFAFSQFVANNNTFIDASLDLRQESSNILLSSHKAMDQPVYEWLDDVTNAEVYAVDFNTLTPFPKTVSISFSESISGLIKGRNANSNGMGYIMANNGFSTTPGDPVLAKFGYLEGFNEYWLSLTSTNTMSTYYRNSHYKKYGTSLPAEVTLPDNSLSITNPSIGNFKFTFSSTYTYRSHYWKKNANEYTIHWLVYTDKSTTPPITELPEAFTTKYPSIAVDNLTYVISDFYKYEDGFTYREVLQEIFGKGHISDRHEFFIDSFQEK